jgi:hypothetical protein
MGVDEEIPMPFGTDRSDHTDMAESSDEYDNSTTTYNCLDNFFSMTDLTLGSDSDSDYRPSGVKVHGSPHVWFW